MYLYTCAKECVYFCAYRRIGRSIVVISVNVSRPLVSSTVADVTCEFDFNGTKWSGFAPTSAGESCYVTADESYHGGLTNGTGHLAVWSNGTLKEKCANANPDEPIKADRSLTQVLKAFAEANEDQPPGAYIGRNPVLPPRRLVTEATWKGKHQVRSRPLL
jgi:hypothetical protein